MGEWRSKLKLQELKHKLHADTISKKDGIITIRHEFYYRFGQSAQTYIDIVKQIFPQAEIVDSGEHWAPFRGGASTANSSHWYVKFKLSKEEVDKI